MNLRVGRGKAQVDISAKCYRVRGQRNFSSGRSHWGFRQSIFSCGTFESSYGHIQVLSPVTMNVEYCYMHALMLQNRAGY